MNTDIGNATTAATARRNTRIAFVSSAGGVLPDVVALADNWPVSIDEFWIAPRAADTEATLAGRRVTWIDEPGDTPGSIMKATAQARSTLSREKIDWVVSAGTAIALPFFLAAKTVGVSTLWVETLNMHGGQGRVAEVCSRLATRTLVQSPERFTAHRRAIFVGELQ